ncbi:MAG: hypothetical protein ABSC49_02060 [Candidatus Microgenomates bacterium]|jgi:hypothetical protein
MNLKRLYQNSVLLPVLIVFTYFCLIVDTVKYPGAVENHFFIGAPVFFAITVTLLLLLDTDSKLMKLVFKANTIFLTVISLIYIVLNLIEGANFTNYILNVYHIHLDGLVYVVIFSLFVFLISKFKSSFPGSIKGLGLLYPAIVLAVTFFMVDNVPYITNMAVSRDSYILFHLGSSYDDRMYYQWGIFYQYMIFVRNNTPTDATIVIPPEEGAWLMGTGEPNFVRAFLYPRTITPESINIPNLQAFGPNTYILIAWGQEECNPDSGCHGWPRQDIKVQKIIYKDPNSSSVIETETNAIYKLGGSQYVYGLIEL